MRSPRPCRGFRSFPRSGRLRTATSVLLVALLALEGFDVIDGVQHSSAKLDRARSPSRRAGGSARFPATSASALPVHPLSDRSFDPTCQRVLSLGTVDRMARRDAMCPCHNADISEAKACRTAG